MANIFVYGTLKRGQPNYHIMTDGKHGKAVFLGKGKTVEKYPLVIAHNANIPFLLNVPGKGHRIDGEIYSVDEQLLQFLDEFEVCPDMYQRIVERIEMVELEKKGKNMANIFVYGTLKRGQPNYHIMTDGKHGKAVFLGKGKTVEKYPLVIAHNANIPFLLNVPGKGHRIDGEIYSVDEQLLQFLDEFEVCPDMYQRIVERIEMVELEKKGDLPKDRQENLGIIDCFIYSTTSYKSEWLNLPYHNYYDAFGEHGLRYVRREDR